MYGLRLLVEAIPHDLFGLMTLDLYTPDFLNTISHWLNTDNESFKQSIIDFFNRLCEVPFNLAERFLDSTNILNQVKSALMNKEYKERSTRRMYLVLLSSLTNVEHRSFMLHLDLWKWILDFFLKAKKGTSFYLTSEIMQHMDVSIGKEILRGAEGVLYKKLEEMMVSEILEITEAGLAVLSTVISIDDYYAEEFLWKAKGLTVILSKLKEKSCVQECMMVISSLNYSREIYREALIDSDLLDYLIGIVYERGAGKPMKTYILIILCEFFSKGSSKQVLKLIHRGILDVIILNCQIFKSILLLDALRRAIKRVMEVSVKKPKHVVQKLYELNVCQVFSKIIEWQREFDSIAQTQV